MLFQLFPESSLRWGAMMMAVMAEISRVNPIEL
jgi:hypothetical protein